MSDYIYLRPEGTLPALEPSAPFAAVVLLESDVSSDWQEKVSLWLVKSGCRFMMAFGLACSSWDDSVDCAAIDAFGDVDGDCPDFVFTTWHESDTLNDVFWFARHVAHHPAHTFASTLIVHIAPMADDGSLMLRYAQAL